MSNRKSPSPNLVKYLHSEVNGRCPVCEKQLVDEVNQQYHNFAEIAHIYPCNPKPNEKELLKNEARLSDDVNSAANLIALCKECHRIFDNPRTIDGYKEMVDLKRELTRQAKLKRVRSQSDLDIDFKDVLIWLHDADVYTVNEVHLSLDVLKISDKADSSVKPTLKFKISSNVQFYYMSIQDQLKKLDSNGNYTSDIIRSQVQTYYLQLKRLGFDHNRIFHEMCTWIQLSNKDADLETCEIVVSFFIQDCEVFS